MKTERRSSNSHQKWIEGFQYIGSRRIADEENAYISRSFSVSSRDKALDWLAFICLVGIFPLAWYMSNSPSPSAFGIWLTVLVVVAFLTPVRWLSWLKRYREDLSDLTFGEVEIYQTGLPTLHSSQIVLLPRSNRVLSQEGRFLPRRKYVEVNWVSSLHELDHAAFPLLYSMEFGSLQLARALTAGEKRELQSHLPHFRSWAWLVPSVLWLWLGYDSLRLLQGTPTVQLVGQATSVLCAAISLSFYFFYRTRKLQRVELDIKRGTVICEIFGNFHLEHLRESDLLWTVGNLPASWRRQPKRTHVCPPI